MQQVQTVYEEGSIWDRNAYDATPTALRVKLAKATNPVILVSSKAPHPIVAANKAWQDQCGYGAEAIGQSPKLLQGELTDMKKAAMFRRELVSSGDARMCITNYSKNGEAFVQKLRAEAVAGQYYYTESQIVPDSPLRRAVLKTGTLSEQMTAVSASLVLTIVTLFLGLAPQATTSLSMPTVTQFINMNNISMEAIPICACFLLALCVLAINESLRPMHKDDLRGLHDKAAVKEAEKAVGIALVHCLACVAIEAPLNPMGGPAAISFVAMLLLLAPREEDWDLVKPQTRGTSASKAGTRNNDVSLLLCRLQEFTHQPLLEIMFTTAVCFFLLAPPFGMDFTPAVVDMPKVEHITYSEMALGLFFV